MTEDALQEPPSYSEDDPLPPTSYFSSLKSIDDILSHWNLRLLDPKGHTWYLSLLSDSQHILRKASLFVKNELLGDVAIINTQQDRDVFATSCSSIIIDQ